MLILDKHKAVEQMLALAREAHPETPPALPSGTTRRIAVFEPQRKRRARRPRASRQPLPKPADGTPARRVPGVPLAPIVF
jgi:hypothetical protein